MSNKRKFKERDDDVAAVASAAVIDKATDKEILDDLQCIVCHELPLEGHVRQCCNGHLMCTGCSNKVLEQAHAKCPVCRAGLKTLGRSLVAERQLARVRLPCDQCDQIVSAPQLVTHKRDECMQRNVACVLSVFGCSWTGVAQNQARHNQTCIKRSLTAHECARILRTPKITPALFAPVDFVEKPCFWFKPISVTLNMPSSSGICLRKLIINRRIWTLSFHRAFQSTAILPKFSVGLMAPSHDVHRPHAHDFQILWSASAPASEDGHKMALVDLPVNKLTAYAGCSVHERVFSVARVTFEFHLGRVSQGRGTLLVDNVSVDTYIQQKKGEKSVVLFVLIATFALCVCGRVLRTATQLAQKLQSTPVQVAPVNLRAEAAIVDDSSSSSSSSDESE
jgi:hypothetical protein